MYLFMAKNNISYLLSSFKVDKVVKYFINFNRLVIEYAVFIL